MSQISWLIYILEALLAVVALAAAYFAPLAFVHGNKDLAGWEDEITLAIHVAGIVCALVVVALLVRRADRQRRWSRALAGLTERLFGQRVDAARETARWLDTYYAGQTTPRWIEDEGFGVYTSEGGLTAITKDGALTELARHPERGPELAKLLGAVVRLAAEMRLPPAEAML